MLALAAATAGDAQRDAADMSGCKTLLCSGTGDRTGCTAHYCYSGHGLPKEHNWVWEEAMQKNNWDGSQELLDAITEGPYETFDQRLKSALEDPKVKSVELHKPGSKVRSNGRTYVVNSKGQWERVDD